MWYGYVVCFDRSAFSRPVNRLVSRLYYVDGLKYLMPPSSFAILKGIYGQANTSIYHHAVDREHTHQAKRANSTG